MFRLTWKEEKAISRLSDVVEEIEDYDHDEDDVVEDEIECTTCHDIKTMSVRTDTCDGCTELIKHVNERRRSASVSFFAFLSDRQRKPDALVQKK